MRAQLFQAHADPRVAQTVLIYGVAIYALHTFYLYTEQEIWGGTTFYRYLGLDWLHYIDVMVFVLFSSIIVSLLVNRIAFGQIARPVWKAAHT